MTLNEEAIQLLARLLVSKTVPQPGEDCNSDEFRMFSYKVLPCAKRFGHDWTDCAYCHPGEKAQRRDPKKFTYIGVACPDMKKTGDCPRGDQCPYAHNVFEYWLHPTRYRSQLCSFGQNCRRQVCFFSHTLQELRPSSLPALADKLAQMQGISEGLQLETFDSPAAANPFSNYERSSIKQSNSADVIHEQLRTLGFGAASHRDQVQADSWKNALDVQVRPQPQPVTTPASSPELVDALMTLLNQFAGGVPTVPAPKAQVAALPKVDIKADQNATSAPWDSLVQAFNLKYAVSSTTPAVLPSVQSLPLPKSDIAALPTTKQALTPTTSFIEPSVLSLLDTLLALHKASDPISCSSSPSDSSTLSSSPSLTSPPSITISAPITNNSSLPAAPYCSLDALSEILNSKSILESLAHLPDEEDIASHGDFLKSVGVFGLQATST